MGPADDQWGPRRHLPHLLGLGGWAGGRSRRSDWTTTGVCFGIASRAVTRASATALGARRQRRLEAHAPVDVDDPHLQARRGHPQLPEVVVAALTEQARGLERVVERA